ncbi:hypothetical protein AOA80_00985 [Methanomassiliicoccales archaeon RumEn M1]|nr:hypothetical protein AOA80_00985 [Methanomassiliicoccales archaeon RumEn M1]
MIFLFSGLQLRLGGDVLHLNFPHGGDGQAVLQRLPEAPMWSGVTFSHRARRASVFSSGR